MKKLLVSFFSFCLVLISGTVFAATLSDIVKNKVVKVGMAPEYTPFEFKDIKGEVKGFDYEIAKKLADSMGVKLQVVQYKFEELIPALKNGEIDIIISGMTKTLKRAREINFTDPYFETGQVVIVSSGLSNISVEDARTCNFTEIISCEIYLVLIL